MKRLLQRLLHPIYKNDDGIAVIEFAFSLPFLVLLFLGGTELTRYMLIYEKAQKIAVTVSDVTAQGQTIAKTDLNNYFTAAAQIMLPYSFGSNGYVIVTSVTQTGTQSVSNPPKINWQYAGGGSWTQTSKIGTTVGSNAVVPVTLALGDKDNIIITEVFYNFNPLLTKSIIGNVHLYETAMYKPRLGALTTLSALPFWMNMGGAIL